MRLYVSAAASDDAAVAVLVSDLQAAGHSVWVDRKRWGDDRWFAEILDKIRGCSVFVSAVSENSLSSKLCRTELQYAQRLGLPYLPVQIGEVLSYRSAELLQRQTVDYRNPTAASGAELQATLLELETKRRRLPEPLPPPPAMPYQNLLRIAVAIHGAAHIPPSDQDAIVSQLSRGLREEKEENIRGEIRGLLTTLQRRGDTTRAATEDVDAILADLAGPKSAGRGPADQTGPAGWFADPSGVPGTLRYWDGSGWTQHTTSAAAGAPGAGGYAAIPAAPAKPAGAGNTRTVLIVVGVLVVAGILLVLGLAMAGMDSGDPYHDVPPEPVGPGYFEECDPFMQPC